MDFSLTQEQQDLRELTAKIFEDLAPLEGLPDMEAGQDWFCLLYTSPSPRDLSTSRMPSSA